MAEETGRVELVQSFERGLRVIRALGGDPQAHTLSDVARATGLSRATCRRLLHTMTAMGYARTDGRDFVLTPRVLELGFAYLSGLGLPALIQPHLERLSEQTGESSSASILDGAEVVYIARVRTHRIMRATINVGTRFPAFATSMGRVLLAGLDAEVQDALLDDAVLTELTTYTMTDRSKLRRALDTTATQGYALVDQELEVGLRAVAAPVRDAEGRVVAAMNVSTGLVVEPTEATLGRILPLLHEAADGASRDLALAWDRRQSL